jgi:hypothetical protein
MGGQGARRAVALNGVAAQAVCFWLVQKRTAC